MDLYNLVLSAKITKGEGGGGDEPTGTKEISITQNGVTTEDVKAYASAKITTNVPNSYAAGDEGLPGPVRQQPGRPLWLHRRTAYQRLLEGSLSRMTLNVLVTSMAAEAWEKCPVM